MSATLPALFAKLATCVNPFIYTLNQTKIKAEVSLRLHTLIPTGVNSPADAAAVAAPYYSNRPSPSRQAGHHNNRRTMMGSQQHRSKAVISRPKSKSLVKQPAARSSMIDNEDNITFNNQILTCSASSNALYGTYEEEHRRQYYVASRLCERRTKSASAICILDNNIIEKVHSYSTVAIDANLTDSSKFLFEICLPVNSEESK